MRRTGSSGPLALLAATAFLLAACSSTPVGPDYKVPDDAVVRAPGAAAPFVSADATIATPQGQAALYSSEPLPAHWWRLYHDPVLDRLITQALAHNTDLRQASANLERVRAVETEADGARYPTIGVGVSPVYGHESGLDDLAPDYVPPTRGLYDAKLSLSYQVDVAGQIRRAIESAQAGSEAAQAALDLVRVNVVASTARAYVGVCSAGLRLQSAQTSLRLQKEALDVSERLQQAGRVGSLDTSRARSQLEQLNAMVPGLQAARQGGLFRLATLMGSVPRDFPAEVANCVQPPRVTTVLPVGDGAALLRRRPDVRQAERDLAASTARIGVAVADLYPKVSFGLSAVSAGPIGDFGKRDTFAWNVGPLISWSVPNTGVVRARIAQAEAGSRINFAKFDGTVLTALRETETALDTYSHELERQASLQAARDASANVAEQARRLYQGGRTGYLDALDAERSLAASEATLAASKAQLADDQIALFLALGGGWEPGS